MILNRKIFCLKVITTKMTKVIIIGDSHSKIDHIPLIDLLIERLCEIAQEQKPDLIVHLGDINDTFERVHVIAQNRCHKMIRALRKIAPVWLLTGNHDYTNNQQFLTDEHSLNGMKEWENVTVVDKVISYKTKGVHLVFVPYVPPGRFVEALNTIGDEWKTANAILCHQEFFNCKMGGIVSTEGDKWPLTNPFIASGHIHLKQWVQSNIYYPGSSIQVGFGDIDPKIVAILTLQPGKPVQVNEIPLNLPTKKIIHVDVENLEDYVPQTDTTDDIKVTVSGNYEQFKAIKKTAKYKELEKQGVKMVFKPKKLKKIDKNEISPAVDSSNNFTEILSSMVVDKKDPYLYQAYEFVVNGNVIKEDSVMFL